MTTKDGPDYQYAWVPGEDKLSGRHAAILSRFPIRGERRTDAYAPIHVAAEVELPTGDEITVIAMHLKEGRNKGAVKKRFRIRVLGSGIEASVSTMRPDARPSP